MAALLASGVSGAVFAEVVRSVRSSRARLSIALLSGISFVSGAAPRFSNFRALLIIRVSREPTVLL